EPVEYESSCAESKRDVVPVPMARAATAFFLQLSNVGRIVRTQALGRGERAVPIRRVQGPALRRSGPRTRGKDTRLGLCFRGCAAPHEALPCRECSPTRHRFLLRELQARDFARRRPQNKAQFPAWRGDRVDARVRTPGCKRCTGSEAPQECLRAL